MLRPTAARLFWAASSEKCIRTCVKYAGSDAKYHSGFCLSFIHSVASIESVRGQQRPLLDCTNAQADPGHRCPHVCVWHGPFDIFSVCVCVCVCVRACVRACVCAIYLYYVQKQPVSHDRCIEVRKQKKKTKKKQ